MAILNALPEVKFIANNSICQVCIRSNTCGNNISNMIIVHLMYRRIYDAPSRLQAHVVFEHAQESQ